MEEAIDETTFTASSTHPSLLLDSPTSSPPFPFLPCNSSACNGPHRFESGLLAEVVYGYLSPFLILVTLVTNCLVCAVLCRKAFRSPTNILLVAMAVSDTLTGLWPAPVFLGFYATGLHREWIPYDWCFAYFCLIEYLPTIFHTSSIWLTVCLAGQRFLYVCKPNLAKNVCTVGKTIRTILVVYALSIFLHGFRLAEMSFHPIALESLSTPGRHVIGCYDRFSPLIKENVEAFYEAYYWTRIVAVHFLPCLLLVVLNGVLVHAMKKAARRRSQLLRQNMRMESRRLEENNSTTMMLVLVVGIFLLVEVPLAVFLVVVVVTNNSSNASQHTVDKGTVDVVSLLVNFFILVSYPLNFFIYCRMSRQFRETFKRLFSVGASLSRASSKIQSTRRRVAEMGNNAGERLAGPKKKDHYEMEGSTRAPSESNDEEGEGGEGREGNKCVEKFTCLLTIEENTAAEI